MSANPWPAALTLAAALLLGSASWGVELSGQVQVSERNKPVRNAAEVVIYYRPDEPVVMEHPTDEFVMSTRKKRFDPRVVVVPEGATVRFPNADPILHNVFSVSGKNTFDVGLYGEGEGDTVEMHSPGLVKVFCNVHQSMVGYILVLDTPFHAMADADGSFRLEGLPEGPGKLYVWHERSRRPVVQELLLPNPQPVTLELKLSKRKVPDHTNKHGEAYRKSRRERY